MKVIILKTKIKSAGYRTHKKNKEDDRRKERPRQRTLDDGPSKTPEHVGEIDPPQAQVNIKKKRLGAINR